MKKKHVFLYILTPLIVEWILSYAVQFCGIFFVKDITNYGLELTLLIAVVTIPFAGIMYYRDNRQRGFDSKKNIGIADLIYVSVGGVLACLGTNILIGYLGLPEMSQNYEVVTEIIYQSNYMLQFITAGVMVPIAEELIYRGLLYKRMREFAPGFLAGILSALVFGLCHGNIVQFVFASVIGMILALVYEKFQRLSMAIWMHMVVNMTSLVITWTIG